MQLISPFLHAHAFGVGAIHGGPGVHIHLDEIDSASNASFDKETIHEQTMPEHTISITAGVSEKFDFDFLFPVILSCISLALCSIYVRRFYTPDESPILQQQTYPFSTPRAPPAHR